jgi:hypothetical protein
VARYARQLDVAGLAPASVARKLAAVSGWYDWLAQRGHISSSSAPAWNGPGCTRRVRPRRPSPPDQALALVHAADSVQGPVERAFSQFRQHRAVTARFDKCDFDWRGTIDVASIRIWAPPEPMI